MPIAIGSTFGALLLSSWVATGLSAIVYFQSYVFFRSRPMQDTRHSATLVCHITIGTRAFYLSVFAKVVTLWYITPQWSLTAKVDNLPLLFFNQYSRHCTYHMCECFPVPLSRREIWPTGCLRGSHSVNRYHMNYYATKLTELIDPPKTVVGMYP